MTPQTATAIQPVKAPVPMKQDNPTDIFDRIEKVYVSIARSAIIVSLFPNFSM